MEKIWRFFTKVNVALPISSSNSTPGDIAKERETRTGKDTYTPIFIAALFTVAKIMEEM